MQVVKCSFMGLLLSSRLYAFSRTNQRAFFPRIRTVIADPGHETRKLARTLKQHQGWQLRIVKRRQRVFKIRV